MALEPDQELADPVQLGADRDRVLLVDRFLRAELELAQFLAFAGVTRPFDQLARIRQRVLQVADQRRPVRRVLDVVELGVQVAEPVLRGRGGAYVRPGSADLLACGGERALLVEPGQPDLGVGRADGVGGGAGSGEPSLRVAQNLRQDGRTGCPDVVARPRTVPGSAVRRRPR
jgi:hypothetical protein